MTREYESPALLEKLERLTEAMRVIEQASRGQHQPHGSWWQLRKWLDARDIYNGDIDGGPALINMVANATLSEKEGRR
jgi:hypothetical protein